MSPEEIKEEMRNIKIPWFIKFADKFWFKIGKYILFFGILSYIPLGIVYNLTPNFNVVDILWTIMVGLFFFLFLGVAGLMLIAHLIKNSFVKKHCKRLGISVFEWNIYSEEIKLTSY